MGIWPWKDPKDPEVPQGGPVRPTPVHAETEARRQKKIKDTAAAEVAAAEVDRIKKLRGPRSTILTGPGGVTTPPTTLKTKLG